MDKYGIDGHKLNFHPRKIADWLKGKNIYPIYMEISPSGACNHRCTFCGLDFMEYQNRHIDADILMKRIFEMGSVGVKSIMFAGEGEPLLHKQMAEIAVHTKKAGIDVAFTTNATLLTKKFCNRTLSSIEWIKVSINAGIAETYSKIHNAPESHFDLVLKNIAAAVEIRNSEKYSCAIGAQMLLLPENQEEVLALAERMRDIGCDYLVIKPHSQHLLSKTKRYENIKYGDMSELSELLKSFNSDKFNVIFRIQAIKKLEKEKPYKHCLALPFWSYITTRGDVYSCSMFLGDERFLLGNIYKQKFRKIWSGKRRQKNMELMKTFDVSNCRLCCRMDACNVFLHSLKNPHPHVNFI